MQLTVIIPVLNAAPALSRHLGALGYGEVIVVDGGSTDDSRQIAETGGAEVLCSPAGRGQQLAAGAEAALQKGADWLLFLHADTQLDEVAWRAVKEHMDSSDLAAYFPLRFDSASIGARLLEVMVAFRCWAFALPYGDQALLIPAALYKEVGGYNKLRLMEDVDIVRRLGRRRLCCLAGCALTSAEKYEREGYLTRSLKNLAILGRYFMGVPVDRLYGDYTK